MTTCPGSACATGRGSPHCRRSPPPQEDPRKCLAAFEQQVDRLGEACVAEGREPDDIHRVLLTGVTPERPLASVQAFRDFAGRYAEAGATDLILHWPRPDEPYEADPAVFERIATAALADVQAGRF
ncbi:hypothetical protein [Acrocarpospora phusangensis]|uniref:hypothetical protein n=1 Tax=Acrocarpospora phusangensis TaxID=1070424 RepID=UPI001EF2777E|nr:hypothetical protein [Acrocarpospora phusangensis]